MVELSRQQTTPQLVPLVDLMAQQRRLAPTEAQANKVDKPVTVAAASREEVSADKAVANEARSAIVVAAGSAAVPVPAAPVAPPVVVVPEVPVAPPTVTQLAWGRYSAMAPTEADKISMYFEDAAKNGRVGLRRRHRRAQPA
jgi:hypothetical protein